MIQAENSTSDKTYFNTNGLNLRLPYQAPAVPPIIAKPAHKYISDENDWADKDAPANPEMEFKKINAADTAAVCFILLQCNNSKTGLNKIPPPMPIIPDTKPSNPPMRNAGINYNSLIPVSEAFPENPRIRIVAITKQPARINL